MWAGPPAETNVSGTVGNFVAGAFPTSLRPRGGGVGALRAGGFNEVQNVAGRNVYRLSLKFQEFWWWCGGGLVVWWWCGGVLKMGWGLRQGEGGVRKLTPRLPVRSDTPPDS